MQDLINEAIMQARRKEEEICMNIIKSHGFDDYEAFRQAGYRIEKEVDQLSQTKTITNIIVYKVQEVQRTHFIRKAHKMIKIFI